MPPSTKPKNDAPLGQFIAFLQRKTGGPSLAQIDKELAELVQAVNNTGRPGTFTYKIKIGGSSKRGVMITDEVTVKAPKLDEGHSVFFIGENGSLLRNDPNQAEMPFAIVPEETSTPRTVAQ